NHRLEVYGICPACKEKQSNN
ncbi:TPA: transcriptional repressor, partial [Listeria monocytogenes]|nr:transcriptional repressor [Listeria monocytogenes]